MEVFWLFQHEAALTVDAVAIVYEALLTLLKQKPDIGQMYDNGTRGVDCEAERATPWRHGSDLMKVLRAVCSSESNYSFCIGIYVELSVCSPPRNRLFTSYDF